MARLRRSWYERRPHARRRLDRPGHQRRQPRRRRQRQDAGRGRARAHAARHGRAARRCSAAATRAGSRRTAWWWSATASACSSRSSDRATSRRCWRARCRACRCSSRRIATWPAGWPSSASAARVHILDDGFQHLQLARDVDLLLVSPARSRRSECCRPGRLREGLDAARVRRRAARVRHRATMPLACRARSAWRRRSRVETTIRTAAAAR